MKHLTALFMSMCLLGLGNGLGLLPPGHPLNH